MALFAICLRKDWNALDTLVTTKVHSSCLSVKSDWVPHNQPNVPFLLFVMPQLHCDSLSEMFVESTACYQASLKVTKSVKGSLELTHLSQLRYTRIVESYLKGLLTTNKHIIRIVERMTKSVKGTVLVESWVEGWEQGV